MKIIYLISKGEYSDYDVCFLAESTKRVSEDEFRIYWLEAVKRKTEYVDGKLEAVAKYLGVNKQSSMYDYFPLVDRDLVAEAFKAVEYDCYRGEVSFFQDILIEKGFSILSHEEYNVDDF